MTETWKNRSLNLTSEHANWLLLLNQGPTLKHTKRPKRTWTLPGLGLMSFKPQQAFLRSSVFEPWPRGFAQPKRHYWGPTPLLADEVRSHGRCSSSSKSCRRGLRSVRLRQLSLPNLKQNKQKETGPNYFLCFVHRSSVMFKHAAASPNCEVGTT